MVLRWVHVFQVDLLTEARGMNHLGVGDGAPEARKAELCSS